MNRLDLTKAEAKAVLNAIGQMTGGNKSEGEAS